MLVVKGRFLRVGMVCPCSSQNDALAIFSQADGPTFGETAAWEKIALEALGRAGRTGAVSLWPGRPVPPSRAFAS